MELVEKIQQISKQDADELKYLYKDMLIGFCHTVFCKAGVPKVNPIPEEYFDAVISGLIDSFYGGIEPEFETEEEYNEWQDNINYIKSAEWLFKEYIRGCDYSHNAINPYQNKSIPFLGIKPIKIN